MYGAATTVLREMETVSFAASVVPPAELVATKVASESPDLYFEIQHLNDYGRESLLALRRAVDKLWQAVSTGDAPQFTAMMSQGREYLAGRVRHD